MNLMVNHIMNTTVYKHEIVCHLMAINFSFVRITKFVHTAFSKLILYTAQTVNGHDVTFHLLRLIVMCTLQLLQIKYLKYRYYVGEIY